MKTPEPTENESRRLSALHATGLLDTPPEDRFDRITRLAAQIFDVPIALVSLVDEHRQWFKSRHGIEITETSRDISFCGHAIRDADVMVVEDAQVDERFHDNPLVEGNPDIRFYAGAPLEDRTGHRLGTICLIDHKPRPFSHQDRANLRDLADLVEREIGVQELGEYYGKRAQALHILNNISLDTEGTESERISRALAAGCRFLGMDTGIISNITGQTYTIRWHHDRGDHGLENGMTFPLHKTFCSLLLAKGDVLAVSHMARSGYSDHPCYTEFRLESYLAAPLKVDDRIFGTLSFYSDTPKLPAFNEIDRMFISVLARWVTEVIVHQQQAEILEKLVTHAPGMLYQYRLWPDGSSAFPYTSPGIQEIYGLTPEEAARDASPVFDRIHPDDLQAVADSIRESAEKLTLWQHQYRTTTAGHQWRWVEGQANPEKLPDGSVLWHGYIVDIDDRRKAEQMKNEFISTVSHELRTPLTSIAGSLELVTGGVTGPLPEKTAEMLRIARRNTHSLRVLIDDLLDIEKLVNGKMPLHISVQPVTSTVKAAIEDIRPYASPKDVEIQLEVVDPELIAAFDPARLKQTLANLLSNAVKFSPEGTTVRAKVGQYDGKIRIDVTDKGTGVPEEFRHRIFQRFAQADSSSARSKEGTGLGLAIARELMIGMGGDIGFVSDGGKETTFWVTLPLHENAPDA